MPGGVADVAPPFFVFLFPGGVDRGMSPGG